MEKENWFLRVSKWAWTPIILGFVVCVAVVAIAKVDSWAAAPAGLGAVCFFWLAMIKAFMK